MPPIHCPWRALTSFHAKDRLHPVYHVSGNWAIYRTLFHPEQKVNDFLKLLIRLRRRFLRLKNGNQHVLQMKNIWLKSSHFHTIKIIWHKNRITSFSSRFLPYVKAPSMTFWFCRIFPALITETIYSKEWELSCHPSSMSKDWQHSILYSASKTFAHKFTPIKNNLIAYSWGLSKDPKQSKLGLHIQSFSISIHL